MNTTKDLLAGQREKLEHYAALLAQFNAKINLISPNTANEVWERHIAHCLSLCRFGFPEGSRVVDWGTGGGLPAIPMAICFPKVHIIGVDAVGKKIQAVRAMARKLGLDNLEAWHGRAESWDGTAHYSISRATAPLTTLWTWHHRVVAPRSTRALLAIDGFGLWEPGLICLKGGDLNAECQSLHAAFPDTKTNKIALLTDTSPSVFAEKYIVHVT